MSTSPAPGEDPADAPLRILFFARVEPGGEARFLKAYDSIRERVATAPGHVAEQVCQAADDPAKWLITSEWESGRHYADWVAQHRFSELSDPVTEAIADYSHHRFLVRRTSQ